MKTRTKISGGREREREIIKRREGREKAAEAPPTPSQDVLAPNLSVPDLHHLLLLLVFSLCNDLNVSLSFR